MSSSAPSDDDLSSWMDEMPSRRRSVKRKRRLLNVKRAGTRKAGTLAKKLTQGKKSDSSVSLSDDDDGEWQPTRNSKRFPFARRKKFLQNALDSSDDDDDESSVECEESEEELSRKQTQTKKKRGAAKKGEIDMHQVQTYGDYVLEFQDDSTGHKHIHPSASRYAFRVMSEESSRTIKSVSQSLAEDGQVAESRIVEKQSGCHVEEIVSRVRRRFNSVMIPARYVQIEDLIASDMAQVNEHRRREIEENKKAAKQLRQKQKELQREYKEAKARRDRLQNEVDSLETKTNGQSILNPVSSKTLQQNSDYESGQAFTSNGEGAPILFPKDSLRRILNQIPSPYDD